MNTLREATRWTSTLDSRRIAERLDDAARILSRAAHDFDNVLTGILGFADLTTPLLSDDSTEHRFVGELSKVGLRGQEMTRLIREFTAANTVGPKSGDLRSAWNSTTASVGRSGVKFLATWPDALPAIGIDQPALDTVLKHVVSNAVESIAKSGEVRLAAEVQELNLDEWLGSCEPGPHVVATISDAGSGIPDPVKPKLFAEPFFTTKVRHRGLGLAIVFRILHAHRGGLAIASDSESGTHVSLGLPIGPPRAKSLETHDREPRS